MSSITQDSSTFLQLECIFERSASDSGKRELNAAAPAGPVRMNIQVYGLPQAVPPARLVQVQLGAHFSTTSESVYKTEPSDDYRRQHRGMP
jgi:hypothetical protein